MNEKDGAIRDANVLGVPKMLILGLQHMFAMFGATILVPILVNSYFGEDVLHVQVTLICAALILIDRQVFSRAFFLHNRVFPAARMCARSLVGISSGKVIGQ